MSVSLETPPLASSAHTQRPHPATNHSTIEYSITKPTTMSANGRSAAPTATTTCEKDSKKVAIDRINSTEGYFGELCSLMSVFARKSASMRDKYDELGRILRHIGDTEAGHDSFSEAMVHYARTMTLMADAKDIEVQRLQTKVVLELAAYESFCKNQKDAVKHSISLREKEASRQQQLAQMRQRSQPRLTPSDMQNGATAVATLPSSTTALPRSSGATDVDELLRRFESQKIQDLKTILLNLTAIELKQHATAIELLTAAYQDIMDIDAGHDAEDIFEKPRKDDRVLKPSHRSQSVGALATLPPNATQLKRRNNGGQLSASAQSVDSPKRGAGRVLMPPPSPDASVDSARRGRSNNAQSDTGTDDDGDDESDDSGSDASDSHRRDRSHDDEDGDYESGIGGDRRKVAGAPAPVPLARLSKLAQSHAAH